MLGLELLADAFAEHQLALAVAAWSLEPIEPARPYAWTLGVAVHAHPSVAVAEPLVADNRDSLCAQTVSGIVSAHRPRQQAELGHHLKTVAHADRKPTIGDKARERFSKSRAQPVGKHPPARDVVAERESTDERQDRAAI